MTTKTLKDISNAELSRLLGVHAQLSPENLSCDGELPRRQVEIRFRALTGELKTLQSTLGLSDAEVEEGAVYREYDARGGHRSGI